MFKSTNDRHYPAIKEQRYYFLGKTPSMVESLLLTHSENLTYTHIQPDGYDKWKEELSLFSSAGLYMPHRPQSSKMGDFESDEEVWFKIAELSQKPFIHAGLRTREIDFFRTKFLADFSSLWTGFLRKTGPFGLYGIISLDPSESECAIQGDFRIFVQGIFSS